MQAIVSDQRGSYLESFGNGFFIVHVLLARYIDGPGDEGRATQLHDQRIPPRCLTLIFAGIMAVGALMSAGPAYQGPLWPHLQPLDGITYGCRALDRTEEEGAA
jgi:hypothetical protein